jgi:hypothetical protein
VALTGRDRSAAGTERGKRGARARLTLIRLFEELRGLGYERVYVAVWRYARTFASNAVRSRLSPKFNIA